MIRALVDMRTLTAMMLAAVVGLWGVTAYPPAIDNVFLQLIALREPTLFRALLHGYAALWFSTAFLAASLVLSVLTIVAYRRAPTPRARTLPRYPKPENRPSPTLVLGETHSHSTRARPRPHVALDSAARPVHGRDDPRRRRHGKDVGLHVSAC